MNTAIYARVSTSNGQDPEMQLRELREYCQRRGWQLEGEYIDSGISGMKNSRPELNRLMADAHKRLFDAVVVWRFGPLCTLRFAPLAGFGNVGFSGNTVC